MCRHKTDPNQKKHYNANDTKHGLTDVIPLVVFIGCVFVGFGIGIVGMGAGNPESLLYGSDYSGVTCGSLNKHFGTDPGCPYGEGKCDMTKRNKITYPRMNDDVIQMVKDGVDFTDLSALKFTGICVSECPKKDTYTCTDAILIAENELENLVEGKGLSKEFTKRL